LVLNNAMIASLAPYALRGAIWYQGEANADQPETYREIFSGVINSWRAQFQNPDLPFYWVQLANWSPGGNADGTEWAFLREAQTQTLSLPHTGQALALDIGNSTDIHPRNKQAVNHRLARLALAEHYGQNVVYRGPAHHSTTYRDNQISVTFDHADGLTKSDGDAPREFEIAGVNGIFHSATAILSGNCLTLTAESVPAPREVRYACHHWIEPRSPKLRQSPRRALPHRHRLILLLFTRADPSICVSAIDQVPRIFCGSNTHPCVRDRHQFLDVQPAECGVVSRGPLPGC
jgi:sialate O-acetylesterase